MEFELVDKDEFENDTRHAHIQKITRYVEQSKIPAGTGELTVWHQLECPFNNNELCVCNAKIHYNGELLYDDA